MPNPDIKSNLATMYVSDGDPNVHTKFSQVFYFDSKGEIQRQGSKDIGYFQDNWSEAAGVPDADKAQQGTDPVALYTPLSFQQTGIQSVFYLNKERELCQIYWTTWTGYRLCNWSQKAVGTDDKLLSNATLLKAVTDSNHTYVFGRSDSGNLVHFHHELSAPEQLNSGPVVSIENWTGQGEGSTKAPKVADVPNALHVKLIKGNLHVVYLSEDDHHLHHLYRDGESGPFHDQDLSEIYELPEIDPSIGLIDAAIHDNDLPLVFYVTKVDDVNNQTNHLHFMPFFNIRGFPLKMLAPAIKAPESGKYSTYIGKFDEEAKNFKVALQKSDSISSSLFVFYTRKLKNRYTLFCSKNNFKAIGAVLCCENHDKYQSPLLVNSSYDLSIISNGEQATSPSSVICVSPDNEIMEYVDESAVHYYSQSKVLKVYAYPGEQELLRAMAGVDTTHEWDLICSYRLEKVNEIMAHQYKESSQSKNVKFSLEHKPPFGPPVQESYEVSMGAPLLDFHTDSHGECLVTIPLTKLKYADKEIELSQQTNVIKMSTLLHAVKGSDYTITETSETVINFREENDEYHVAVKFKDLSPTVEVEFPKDIPGEIEKIKTGIISTVTEHFNHISEIDYSLATVNNSKLSDIPASSDIKPKSFIFRAQTKENASVLMIAISVNDEHGKTNFTFEGNNKSQEILPVPGACERTLIIRQKTVIDYFKRLYLDKKPYDALYSIGKPECIDPRPDSNERIPKDGTKKYKIKPDALSTFDYENTYVTSCEVSIECHNILSAENCKDGRLRLKSQWSATPSWGAKGGTPFANRYNGHTIHCTVMRQLSADVVDKEYALTFTSNSQAVKIDDSTRGAPDIYATFSVLAERVTDILFNSIVGVKFDVRFFSAECLLSSDETVSEFTECHSPKDFILSS